LRQDLEGLRLIFVQRGKDAQKQSPAADILVSKSANGGAKVSGIGRPIPPLPHGAPADVRGSLTDDWNPDHPDLSCRNDFTCQSHYEMADRPLSKPADVI